MFKDILCFQLTDVFKNQYCIWYQDWSLKSLLRFQLLEMYKRGAINNNININNNVVSQTQIQTNTHTFASEKLIEYYLPALQIISNVQLIGTGSNLTAKAQRTSW